MNETPTVNLHVNYVTGGLGIQVTLDTPPRMDKEQMEAVLVGALLSHLEREGWTRPRLKALVQSCDSFPAPEGLA